MCTKRIGYVWKEKGAERENYTCIDSVQRSRQGGSRLGGVVGWEGGGLWVLCILRTHLCEGGKQRNENRGYSMDAGECIFTLDLAL